MIRTQLNETPVDTLEKLKEKHLACGLESTKHKRELKAATHKVANYYKPVIKFTEFSLVPEERRVHPDDVVITITFSSPTKKKLLKAQSLQVLGTSTLNDLRPYIYCVLDVKDSHNSISGFFFIEDTFYTNPEAPVDYSSKVKTWLEARDRRKKSKGKEGIPVYQQKDMRITCFNDLKISLDKQYVYCHQGQCEHIFRFESVRQLVQSDSKDKSEYPITIFQSKIRHNVCACCQVLPARYITYGDELAPESPALFCEDCYKRLHYSAPNDTICNKNNNKNEVNSTNNNNNNQASQESKGVPGKLLYTNFKVVEYYHDY